MPIARFDPGTDYYQVLGLDPSCTPAQIKRAFRAIALVCHPDRAGGDATQIDQFKSASAAYEVLGDPDRRAAYDDARAATSRRAPASSYARVVVVRTSGPPADPRDAPWRQQAQADLNRMRDEINANALRARNEINANAERMRNEINANAERVRNEINANALRYRRAMQENRARVRAEMVANAERFSTAATASADQARSRVEEAGGSDQEDVSAPQIAAYVQAIRSQIGTHADLIRAHAPPSSPSDADPGQADVRREVARELAVTRRFAVLSGLVSVSEGAVIAGTLLWLTSMVWWVAILAGLTWSASMFNFLLWRWIRKIDGAKK